jgi:hypothetical protein
MLWPTGLGQMKTGVWVQAANGGQIKKKKKLLTLTPRCRDSKDLKKKVLTLECDQVSFGDKNRRCAG